MKDEIVNRCHEHAKFMDGQFFSKGEGYDWSGKTFTYFIQTLAVGFPLIPPYFTETLVLIAFSTD